MILTSVTRQKNFLNHALDERSIDDCQFQASYIKLFIYMPDFGESVSDCFGMIIMGGEL